jgi:hypothetical protein
MSACETGLGKLRGGDELTGLTRTLLTAGADTVVSSLWQVSDESTSMVMQEFYRRLHDGLAPAAALRDASLAVRAKYPHPFYWVPFVETGRSCRCRGMGLPFALTGIVAQPLGLPGRDPSRPPAIAVRTWTAGGDTRATPYRRA